MAQYTKEELRHIFQSPFNQEAWKAILHNLFRVEKLRTQPERFTTDDEITKSLMAQSLTKR
jgi:hypothetical protein